MYATLFQGLAASGALGGLVKTLLKGTFAFMLYKSVKQNLNSVYSEFYFSEAIDNPVLKILFYLSIALVFAVIFMETFVSFFKIKGKKGPIRTFLLWSLPISVFSFLAIFIYINVKKADDPLFRMLRGVKTQEEVKTVQSKEKINHYENAQNDKNYLTKAISNKYTRYVYDQIASECTKAQLNAKDEKGFTPLMRAALENNFDAAWALIDSGKIDFTITTPLYKPNKIGVGDFVSGTSEFLKGKKKEYNAYKIASFEGNKTLANILRNTARKTVAWNRERDEFRVDNYPRYHPMTWGKEDAL